MPAQDTYDKNEMRARLQAWLASKLLEATDLTITDLAAPEATGHSSETIMIDATWREGGEEGAAVEASLVVRTKPTGHTVFPTYDLARQFEVMRRVSEAAPDLPMPPLRWMESSDEPLGREFLVMDKVAGVVPPDNLPYTMGGWLLEATPDQQRHLQDTSVDTLADLHAIDWRAAGLDLLDEPEYGTIGLDQQLGWWERFLEWGRMGRPQPTLDRMAEWLRANCPAEEPEPVLNWGDSRIGNMLYRDFEPVAVLDWEMATLGPREVDLAWMVLFEHFFSSHLGMPNLPGFADRDEVVARYEARSGHRVGPLDWYLLWGAFRYAAVMMRIVQAAELAGNDIGFTLDDNVAITMLEGLESQLC